MPAAAGSAQAQCKAVQNSLRVKVTHTCRNSEAKPAQTRQVGCVTASFPQCTFEDICAGREGCSFVEGTPFSKTVGFHCSGHIGDVEQLQGAFTVTCETQITQEALAIGGCAAVVLVVLGAWLVRVCRRKSQEKSQEVARRVRSQQYLGQQKAEKERSQDFSGTSFEQPASVQTREIVSLTMVVPSSKDSSLMLQLPSERNSPRNSALDAPLSSARVSARQHNVYKAAVSEEMFTAVVDEEQPAQPAKEARPSTLKSACNTSRLSARTSVRNSASNSARHSLKSSARVRVSALGGKGKLATEAFEDEEAETAKKAPSQLPTLFASSAQPGSEMQKKVQEQNDMGKDQKQQRSPCVADEFHAWERSGSHVS